VTCPQCGCSMTLDRDARLEVEYAVPYHVRWHPILTKLVRTTILSCNGCEFAAKVNARGEVTVCS